MELVGFEPTSKQGNHTLSTCLFWPSVFVTQQDPDHQLRPYPLKFHPCGEAHISDLPAPLCPQIRNNILGAMSRSAKPCGGIKLIYYTSIKQRERSCFRQLNF